MKSKKGGYLFIELIGVMFLFSLVLFPMVMLTDKNITKLIYLKKDYEIKKLSHNLENIFLNLLEKNSESRDFYIIPDTEKENVLILKNGDGEIVTKLRNIKNISDVKISINEKKIFKEESGIKEEFYKILVLEIQIENKIIRKFLNIKL